MSLSQKLDAPLRGMIGAATGLGVSDLLAEWTAKVTGQAGYMKAIIKTIVKAIVAMLFLTFGQRQGMKGKESQRTFLTIGAYAGLGSIVIDWIAAAIPGGIPGIAEKLSLTVQTWGAGAQAIQSYYPPESSVVQTPVADSGTIRGYG